jgi:biotin carboxylase
MVAKYQIICVRSSLNLGSFFLKAYHAQKEYFTATIDFESLPQILDRLKALPCNVIAVFAGCEPGVELADQLAEALGLPAANGTALTNTRKDKAAMQERLRDCGIPAADQIRSASLDELLRWATARNQWPCVAKPTGSSGSDGIFFCQNTQDLRAAHDEVVGKTNPNGKVNAELVVQEFLAGTEYIVDTVSHEGKHICVAMWVYRKRKGTPWNPNCIVSEGNMLLEPSGEVQDQLASYVFRVLDAVGMRFGPCHTEVMLTPRGPILVEVNARLHGLQGPHLIGLATGTSKATYAVDALAEGGQLIQKRLSEKACGRWLYPLQKRCLQLVLISPEQGYLKTDISTQIRALHLASVVEVLPSVQQGQYLHRTCDLNTAAGYVLMVHESSEQIEADRLSIRAAEEKGRLYKVSQQPLPQSPVASPKSPGSAYRSPSSPRLQSVEKVEELMTMDLDNFELPTGVDLELQGGDL